MEVYRPKYFCNVCLEQFKQVANFRKHKRQTTHMLPENLNVQRVKIK